MFASVLASSVRPASDTWRPQRTAIGPMVARPRMLDNQSGFVDAADYVYGAMAWEQYTHQTTTTCGVRTRSNLWQ